MQRDFSAKGVKFYYVYKTLAHPETNAFVRPFSIAERLMHVQEAKQRLDTRFAWICDTMSGDVKRALGNAPNSEFVIDPKGGIVRKRAWSDPDQLREDLIELVGPIDNPTETVEIEFRSPHDDEGRPASGVLDPVKPASPTTALNVEPLASDLPFYVKLRAEADRKLSESGEGQMYLGLHIDPIHRVHWNNLADPPQYELILPAGVHATPQSGSGPKVEVEADVDPREFLIDVTGFTGEPILVKVRYFACDDAESFCIPVEQEYKIRPSIDPDGGWVFARGERPDGRRRTALAKVDAKSDRPEDETIAATGASSDGGAASPAAHFEGQLDGHIEGYVRAQLNGQFRGRLDGSFQDARVTIEGQLNGKVEGLFQGHMAGQYSGEFRGRLISR